MAAVASEDGIGKKFKDKVTKGLNHRQKEVRRHDNESEVLAKDALATAATDYPPNSS